jgi:hypothetical protein
MPICIKNIIKGELAIGDLSLKLAPGEVKEVAGVSTIEEAMQYPSVRIHVIRGRLEVFEGTPSAPKKKEKPKSSIAAAVKKIVTPKKKSKVYTKKELEGLKMDKLRKIGKPLGAKDTKKSELIAEILKAQKKRG